MTFWVIRHKASGLLMPQMKRGRGYSHWNPGSEAYRQQPVFAEMSVPRLLKSLKQAQRVAREWVIHPCAFVMRYQGSWSEEASEDWKTKPDGRQASDIEVVEVQLTGV